MSQDLDTGAAEEQHPAQAAPRQPSATRRVRARLARRITAQRSAPVKQVLEPLAAVHRELHPKAELPLLQRAYDVAEEMHRDQRRYRPNAPSTDALGRQRLVPKDEI